jgi:hypothetical protein
VTIELEKRADERPFCAEEFARADLDSRNR